MPDQPDPPAGPYPYGRQPMLPGVKTERVLPPEERRNRDTFVARLRARVQNAPLNFSEFTHREVADLLDLLDAAEQRYAGCQILLEEWRTRLRAPYALPKHSELSAIVFELEDALNEPHAFSNFPTSTTPGGDR